MLKPNLKESSRSPQGPDRLVTPFSEQTPVAAASARGRVSNVCVWFDRAPVLIYSGLAAQQRCPEPHLQLSLESKQQQNRASHCAEMENQGSSSPPGSDSRLPAGPKIAVLPKASEHADFYLRQTHLPQVFIGEKSPYDQATGCIERQNLPAF